MTLQMSILKFIILSYILLNNLYANQNLINISLKSEINLTSKELKFLSVHKKIILGTEQSWRPYVFVDNNGKISGYDNAVLNLVNKVSGANFQLKAGEWKKIVKSAEEHRLDGLSTCVAHSERKKYFAFSKPYITMEKMVLTSNMNKKNIHNAKDLDGKTVAIHKSNLVEVKTAKSFKNLKILYFNEIKNVIEAVVTGKADVMFGNGATLYLANELGFSNLHLVFPLHSKLELSFGVRKDWPEAITILNKSLNYIGEQKLLELKKQWFLLDKNKSSKKLNLSVSESNYLKNKKVINICVDPNWMPYEEIRNDKFIGISADYMDLVQKQLTIPIKLIKTESWSESLHYAKLRKCDILTLAIKNASREKYLNFTKPYIEAPLVIATKPNVHFIVNYESLKGKKIGISKEYAFAEILKKKYSYLNLIEVADIEDGLKKVKDGQIFAYIGTLASIGYQFQKSFVGELKIAGKFDDKLMLSMGVRNDEVKLLNILDKVLNNISADDKKSILNKWIAINYEKNIDFKYMYQGLGIVLIIILFFIYNQMKLRRKIDEATANLQEKNKNLEESIENFQDILDGTMEMVIFYSIDTQKIIDINKSGLNMLGISDKSKIIGRHIKEFILETELQKVNEAIKKEVTEPYELILLREDKTLLYTINRGRNMRRDGKVVRMTTLIDLTEIKRQDKLLQAQSRMAQMGEMIGMIAHQWRQPLGAINSAIFSVQTKLISNKYNLEDAVQREEFIKFLNDKHSNVNEYVQFLSTTIDDFRNFFKKDKEKEYLNITDHINRALKIVKIPLENKGINIITEFDTDKKIHLYQNEMMQVILNILKNSEDNFDESNKANKTIVIRTKDDKDKSIITICDNGGGIKEDIIDNIFDPYFSTKNERNGTGLGLYMSKIIVEKHNNGTIKVHNKDEGVFFTMEFIKSSI